MLLNDGVFAELGGGSVKTYSGKCSAKQLQKFLLLAMGVRFDEIQRVQPMADENLLYLPRLCWARFYQGKRWRAEFASNCFPRLSLDIKGKAKGICGYPSTKIIKIEKVSSSGNTLQIHLRYGGLKDSDMEFSVSVGQMEGVKESNWFWMWRALDIELVPTEN